MNHSDRFDDFDGVAIIGLSCRFPGANNIDEFWQNLQDGKGSITFFSDRELEAAGVDPALLNDPHYIKASPSLEDVELFDAYFFGFNPREAELMNPQTRIFLECAWEALENAGYNSEMSKDKIGIYAGMGPNTYLLNNLYPNLINSSEVVDIFQVLIGNDKDYLTTHVSYKLNLKGPSVNVQTACSTSLVAVHLACESLLNNECDMALAGGVKISIPQKMGYFYQEQGLYSPDGYCRTFDAKAQGTVFGSGVGIVVLKRLADALRDRDYIRVVIRGSAINNDGSLKMGYTAPSIEGQADVIAEALAIAGVEPETIDYVEAHGTGTPLGDPIEIEALTRVFRTRTQRKGFCAIGSVKTNVGHLDTAAGVAGLVKTVLALEHKRIPPSLNFEQPNPKIDFANSPFYVNTTLTEWESNGTPRRAGVSSFGIGGTNAHLVLEEAPVVETSALSRPYQLLLFSAKTSSALEVLTTNLIEHLKKQPDLHLADVAYTLQVGRREFDYRRMVVCENLEQAVNRLESLDSQFVSTAYQEAGNDPPVIFMFPGGGAQYVNMGRNLYHHEPLFRQQVDLCAELLKPHLRHDLRDFLYPDQEPTDAMKQTLTQTSIALPALFVVEYALAKLWMSWGVHPQAMIGHSLGEYVAACLAGVFSLEDVLKLVVLRGQLFEQLPSGAMLSISLPEEEVRTLLGEHLSLAAVNGPSQCVVSGPTEVITELAKLLADKEVGLHRLHIDVAAHSHLVEPILAPFAEFMAKLTLSPPQISFVSNVTGTWITAAEATDPSYWARHLRQTIRFADGIRMLGQDPGQIFLEVGPGQTLSALAKLQPGELQPGLILASIRHPYDQQADSAFLANILGKLWLAGVKIDWSGFYAHERRRRLPLPTYPFERRRYWIDSPQRTPKNDIHSRALTKKRELADWFYTPTWRLSVPPILDDLADGNKPTSCWWVFNDRCGIGSLLIGWLTEAGQEVIVVEAGERFTQLSRDVYAINPRQASDYGTLVHELHALDRIPNTIIHLWTVTQNDPTKLGLEILDELETFGFYSLLFLMQALAKQHLTDALDLRVISNNMHYIANEAVIYPEKALVLGPCKVIPQEYPEITCQSIDIVLPEPGTPQAEKLINQLLAELTTPSPDKIIAYRGYHRWVQHFEAIRLEQVNHPTDRLRTGGVYLITGGTGGLGLIFAEYLARRVQAKLILTQRSTFPARDEWERWLTTHGDQDIISRKIHKLQELESLGAEIFIISADVADREQMQNLVTQTTQRFGKIHGLIHAAGVADGNMIELETPAVAASVLGPKVKGTLVIESVLKDMVVDFVVLCSSTIAITGGFGQVDYCTANMFLDAFAHANAAKCGPFTVSINWDIWQGVGMALNAAARLREIQQGVHYKTVGHPLLERLMLETAEQEIYFTELSVTKHWVLDEHRIMGNAVIPGSGYLEMARAAFDRHPQKGGVEMQEVFFTAPLMVRDNEKKAVYLVLKKEDDLFKFSIRSKANSDDGKPVQWQEHALGKIGSFAKEAPQQLSLDEIARRCQLVSQEFTSDDLKEKGFIQTGPRWRTLRKAQLGDKEALIFLELSEEFSTDLETFKLHPALLDVATVSVGFLEEGTYLPLAYERLKIKEPLTRKVFNHVKLKTDHSRGNETITGDMVIMDEHGVELMEIKGFTLRRVRDEAINPIKKLGESSSSSPIEHLLPVELTLAVDEVDARKGWMLPEEGLEVFNRILAGNTLPQIIVSTGDLTALIEQANSLTASRLLTDLADFELPRTTHTRPNLKSSYSPPESELEQRLAAIWQKVLGIDQVGIHDNFFELGGTSLAGIQVVSQLKKALNIEIPIVTIFELPTVSLLAQHLSTEQPEQISFQHSHDRAKKKEAVIKRQKEFMSGKNG